MVNVVNTGTGANRGYGWGCSSKDCYLTMKEQNIREIREVTLSLKPPFTSLSVASTK